MQDSRQDNPLQVRLIELVFADAQSPQTATRMVIEANPDARALELVYVLALIATDLQASFHPDPHWTYADWLEAAVGVSCSVYAAGQMGISDPTLAEISQF